MNQDTHELIDFLNDESANLDPKEFIAKQNSEIIIQKILDQLKDENIEILKVRNYLWFSRKMSVDVKILDKTVTLFYFDQRVIYKRLLEHNYNTKHWSLSVKSNDLNYEITSKSFDAILDYLKNPKFLKVLASL